jgi:hypothetical protein
MLPYAVYVILIALFLPHTSMLLQKLGLSGQYTLSSYYNRSAKRYFVAWYRRHARTVLSTLFLLWVTGLIVSAILYLAVLAYTMLVP